MDKRITGIISYHDLEGGFWGIDTGTEKYLPVNIPEQMKSDGSKVTC